MSILDQMSVDEQTKRRIWQMAQTIGELQRAKGEVWIRWEVVAKRQEGSEELADLLKSLADLPDARPLFRVTSNGRAVCLTEKGKWLAEEVVTNSDPLTDQVAAIVKRYAGRLRRLRFSISNIYHVGKTKKKYVYAVEVELGDTLIPNEAPVVVAPYGYGTWVNGRIVGQDSENNLLYVSLENSIEQAQLPLQLFIDRAFLLNQLAESIQKLNQIPPLGQVFFAPDTKTNYIIANEDSGRVALMLAASATPWTRFLWGPPGAGKTFCLAGLMLRLIKQQPQGRILLVAPSNVAVDVALSQLVNQLENSEHRGLLSQRRILRYGYPRKAEILSRSELLGSMEQETLSSQISGLASTIQAATKGEEAQEERLALMRAELLELQEQLKDLVLSHMQQCLVVATTTTQAYMPTSPIIAQSWDTVLVDEVTMVPPAVCLYLSSLAKQRFLLAGDPRQLGPVYEEGPTPDEETDYWMGYDAYDFAQLSIGNGDRRHIQIEDKRLVRITSQRRCISDIWRVIQHLYPEVYNAVDESRVGQLRLLPPAEGQGVFILNMGKSDTNVGCERASKSWQNRTSAFLGVIFAQTILERATSQGIDISIAIITPYRAQYKLIKEELKNRGMKQHVEVGTIHQFQGSEADVVIFDIVDGPGREKLGKLLRGDTGIRLVNVAISRARGKLIILADVDWCRQAMRRDDNTLLWDVVVGTASSM